MKVFSAAVLAVLASNAAAFAPSSEYDFDDGWRNAIKMTSRSRYSEEIEFSSNFLS